MIKNRRLKAMFIAQICWVIFICALGFWWGSLILKHSARIVELEKQLGIVSGLSENNWSKMQRMLYWEGGTVFILLLASTVLLFWLYWRDVLRSKSIQAFFASLTHELRTPLTSIRLQAEALVEDKKYNETMLDRLLEDTLRLESQVERTLELARVEGGGALHLQPVRLRPLIEQTIKACIETHPNQVTVDMKVEDTVVSADTIAVQIILKNLFENSLRHTYKEKIKITISTTPDRNRIWLKYNDNGDGIKEKQIRYGRIFQKGQKSTGAGVGLYLISILMQRMNGKARFEAEQHFPGFPVSLLFKRTPDV
ncbi:MAG: HAMP domain-containing histidine kinase [Deltaproteobacteria bacterium]|nr:HAMP domain-containing histidine kinase [Deltaproteobacteria bacterium]